MENVVFAVGWLLLTLGGILLLACVLLLLGWLLCEAWMIFSVNFRAILKTESLILDYRKNREKFLEWREGEENMWKGRMEALYGKDD